MRKTFAALVFFAVLLFCACAQAEFNLPASLKSIGNDAFSGTAAEEVVLEQPVEEVGTGALANMPNLHTVIIRTSEIVLHNPDFDPVISRSPVREPQTLAEDQGVHCVCTVSDHTEHEINKLSRLMPGASFHVSQNAQTTYGNGLDEAALRAQTRVELYPLEFVFP